MLALDGTSLHGIGRCIDYLVMMFKSTKLRARFLTYCPKIDIYSFLHLSGFLSSFGLVRVADNVPTSCGAGPSGGLPMGRSWKLSIQFFLFYFLRFGQLYRWLHRASASYLKSSNNRVQRGIARQTSVPVSDALAIAGLDKAGIVDNNFQSVHTSDVRQLALQSKLSPCLPHPF